MPFPLSMMLMIRLPLGLSVILMVIFLSSKRSKEIFRESSLSSARSWDFMVLFWLGFSSRKALSKDLFLCSRNPEEPFLSLSGHPETFRNHSRNFPAIRKPLGIIPGPFRLSGNIQEPFLRLSASPETFRNHSSNFFEELFILKSQLDHRFSVRDRAYVNAALVHAHDLPGQAEANA